jgi:hypothetical protein
MKITLKILVGLSGLVSVAAFSSCTTYIDPSPGVATTTTIDPITGTQQRTVTTQY